MSRTTSSALSAMFKSFRKRPATPPPEPEPPRKSPSLPQLSATGLQWPADLVDPDALRSASPEPEATDDATPGSPASPAKTSLGAPGPVPWHKPFRAMSVGNGSGEHTISRLYERERAAAFDPRAGTESPAPTVTARPRRPVRAPPHFNLMVRFSIFMHRCIFFPHLHTTIGRWCTGNWKDHFLASSTRDLRSRLTAYARAACIHAWLNSAYV